jgi:hypothetical protein
LEIIFQFFQFAFLLSTFSPSFAAGKSLTEDAGQDGLKIEFPAAQI